MVRSTMDWAGLMRCVAYVYVRAVVIVIANNNANVNANDNANANANAHAHAHAHALLGEDSSQVSWRQRSAINEWDLPPDSAC